MVFTSESVASLVLWRDIRVGHKLQHRKLLRERTDALEVQIESSVPRTFATARLGAAKGPSETPAIRIGLNDLAFTNIVLLLKLRYSITNTQ